MYGWDIAVLNGFGTMANILSIIAAAVFGWWCKKRGPKSLILAGCIMGAVSMFMWGRVTSIGTYALWYTICVIASSAYCQIGILRPVCDCLCNSGSGLRISGKK